MKIAAPTRLARSLFALTTAFVVACSGAPTVSHTGDVEPVDGRAVATWTARVGAEAESEARAMEEAAEAEAARLRAAEEKAAEERAAEAAEAAEQAERELVARRMKADEVTSAHGFEATRILKSTYHLPMGSEIRYELDGAPFMAKIELHWHEPHVHPLPWGWHRGISLYVLEPAS